MVCLRNIRVNTLHKVDTDDDDNHGEAGTISKSFAKYPSNKPGRH
jgi:hypothetical protein